VKLTVQPLRAALRAPFAAAWGTISERELLLLRLEDADGEAGYGEAAPLPSYDGANVERVRAALDDYTRVLTGAASRPRRELLWACAEVSDLPQALAAIDIALWDLEARRRRLPLCRLLADRAAPEVTVNATVAAEDPAEVSAAVASALTQGFRCVKVKVAIGDDEARLAAARAAGGEDIAIRIDANGAWSAQEAPTALGVLAAFGIEVCEEPVHGLEETARVAAVSPVPIALDETANIPGALERRLCDAVCLKVGSSAGISGLLDRTAAARAADYRVYLASVLDGPVGIAAALHAAAAIGPDLPCGLATLAVFANRPDPLPPRAGRIPLPPGPGLGEGLLEWYR
jgi:L-Ala-D/L-Glu epimerase